MDFFENRYYNANRLYLSVIGIWPYQSMRQKVAIQLCFIITYGTIAVVLVWKITTMQFTVWYFAYCFQYLGLGTVFMSNFIYGWLCVHKLRRLLEHIKSDWSFFEPCDVEIIEPYTELGRKCTIGSAAVCLALPLFLMFETKRPDHTLNPNVTVEEDIFEILLPFDRLGLNYEKYFILIGAVCGTLIFFMFTTTLALGTLYLASVLHACGLFKIAGRRMESMFNDLQEDISLYKNKVILLVFQSIMLHTRAINFTDIVNSFYGPLYLSKLVFAVILLSIDILQMTHAYNTLRETGKVIVNITHSCGVFALTAAFCFTGQALLDHSTEIFVNVYSSQWHAAPVELQKLVLVIMARSMKESGISLTKSITASFEMLATILQMSLSYFMAINSLQEK